VHRLRIDLRSDHVDSLQINFGSNFMRTGFLPGILELAFNLAISAQNGRRIINEPIKLVSLLPRDCRGWSAHNGTTAGQGILQMVLRHGNLSRLVELAAVERLCKTGEGNEVTPPPKTAFQLAA
jgi:hypothetical protein